MLPILINWVHATQLPQSELRFTGFTLSESFPKPLVASDQKGSGQFISAALLVQALRGLPCLGSFSVVRRVRHIEPPLLGYYSVDPQVRHLKEPGWGPALKFSAWGA